MLFPCDNKFSEIRFSRSVPPALRDHINQQSPSPRLRRVAQDACYCFLLFFGAPNRITDDACKTRDILPTDGWLRVGRGCDQRSSGGCSAGWNTCRRRRIVWQGTLQKGSNDGAVSGIDIHRTSTQRVWKVIGGGIISCVVRKQIQQSSAAATGCTEIQGITAYRVIRVTKLSDIL